MSNDYYVQQMREAEKTRREAAAQRREANAASPTMFELGARSLAAGALAKYLFSNRGAR